MVDFIVIRQVKKIQSRMDSAASFTLVSNGLMYAYMYAGSPVHFTAKQDHRGKACLQSYVFTNSTY